MGDGMNANRDRVGADPVPVSPHGHGRPDRPSASTGYASPTAPTPSSTTSPSISTRASSRP
ncbi:MAG: hypothetical protein MZV64_09855 [Ignavibacteriales bacterium]|nr:hypothetical protein [Ignavibacteriales bacterium]